MVTTVQVDEGIKFKLDKLKVHNRETYNEVIKRLIENSSLDYKDSLIETIDILSDSETMRDIAEAMDQFRKKKYKSLEEVEKNLGIND